METNQRPVLFVSSAESGLLNPLLVLAGELARRGVPDLWFATDESRRADVERLSAASLVRFVAFGTPERERSSATMDQRDYENFAHRSRLRSRRSGFQLVYDPAGQAAKLRELRDVVDRNRPALMVIDGVSVLAVALAISRGIPFVLSNPFLVSHVMTGHVPLLTKSHLPWPFPVPHSGLPLRMTLRQQVYNQVFKLNTLGMFLGPAMRSRLRADVALCAELDIPGPARRAANALDRAELVLNYTVREVDYPLSTLPNMRMVGAMLPPLPEAPDDTAVTDWLDAHPSVVYIGLGTITRLSEPDLRGIVEVARRLGGRHHVLWKLPKAQQELLPPQAELPDNLRIETWLPSQHDVLAHPSVKVFLTHGGSNGFHECLYFGTPMVIRPLWADCHDVAARGQDLGVSLTVDDPYVMDPDDLVHKITRVADEGSFRAAAERVAMSQRAAGGRDAAADLVLDRLNQRQ
ncbi:glycosyltransferase [Actinophytocola xanthii]|uniref:MGT family glycosyltransferase n=1 Tax=Actinophytocola xanthii TaxID=1912961 RepID=A0A1Q8CS49_9PSEU|nr:glycosyltransferase [Actinophytocola xanthii]OLF17191.1 MGT family glycosyltransferase [Actinophytocola xanthii]